MGKYHSEDFPYGLRCAECNEEFIEDQPIAEQLDSMLDDIPMVVLVCVPCGLGRPVSTNA
jgi:hypothetical protein